MRHGCFARITSLRPVNYKQDDWGAKRERSKILGNDMRVGRVLSEKLRTLEDGGRGKLIACVRGNRGGGPTWGERV